MTSTKKRWFISADAKRTLFVSGMIVAVMASCQTPRPDPITGHKYTTPTEHYENVVVYGIDRGLSGIPRGDLQIADVRTDWTADGRLIVVVEIENRTRRALSLQIQTQFKDAQDRFLRDSTPYKTVVLPRNQTTRYEAVAFDKNAERAIVRVRRWDSGA